ncbi:MAG: DUF4838 domain-containing protein [Oscillospiraceae bacterium]|nr:DUF4838 domain-containing protein [Oscillospiraceae bacterium]
MLFKISYCAPDAPVAFAARELRKYLKLIYPEAEIVVLRGDAARAEFDGALSLRIDESIGKEFPAVKNPALDDCISIDVSGGVGVISGVNARSVLIAAYRYLRELGCAWLFPGPGGEKLPKSASVRKSVRLCEAASYRHRGMCIEGAVSADHVLNVLDWLPKVGMNGWFSQFFTPFAFFDRWYSHIGNKTLNSEPLTLEEIAALSDELVTEIQKRALMYHSAGHGWTCEPFGIAGIDWEQRACEVPPESVKYLAQVNGVRGLSDGLPLNTHLCYSQSEVLERMTDAAAALCARKPEISYLHFWLADGQNNHCECDGCKDTLPADYYIKYLNLLDEKLTAMGLSTKVVFLIYVDLLWEPREETLKNPDRFVLMFAPITRTYASSYAETLSAGQSPELAPYRRNRLLMPRTVAENVARLKKWQARFSGDSFIFDYHFMWDHFRDISGMKISRVLFEDMRGLSALGLNGMVSCQLQRAFFPTGLGVSLMAAALWNAQADFETEVTRYFKSSFGRNWRGALSYLKTLGTLCDPAYLRHERPQADIKAAKDFEKAARLVKAFIVKADAEAKAEASSRTGAPAPWGVLRAHADYALLLLDALQHKARGGDRRVLYAKWRALASWAMRNETLLSDVFDVYYFMRTMKNIILRDEIALF